MDDFLSAMERASDLAPEAALAAGGIYLYKKLLGPSVDAVGASLGEFTTFRMNNLLRIGEKAQRRLAPDADDKSTVHPVVAKELLNAGSWIDNDLHQEYMAAMLVGSRSTDGEDDSPAYYSRIIGSLTSSMVRVHYAMYRAYEGNLSQATLQLDLTHPETRKELGVSAAVDDWRNVASMNGRFDPASSFSTAVAGLLREGLIADCGFTPKTQRKNYGLVPSLLGFTIFAGIAFGADSNLNMIRVDRTQLKRIRPNVKFLDQEMSTYLLTESAVGRV